jgi:hypothetical protein
MVVKPKSIIWKEKKGSKLNLIQAIFLFMRDYFYLSYLYNYKIDIDENDYYDHINKNTIYDNINHIDDVNNPEIKKEIIID